MAAANEHSALAGLLFIGDPHLSAHAPGWRKDDYPQSILAKLRWCLAYARDNRLMPVLLGDMFHLPRDTSNQLLVELLSTITEPIWAVAGNHDCHENSLTDSDTLAVLQAAGRVRLLDVVGPWLGTIANTTVIVGGTCWGQSIPREFDSSKYKTAGLPTLVFWVTHHDVRFPGYEEAGRMDCREIPGIDAVINGHIHRDLPQQTSGQTTWLNPGNIARVSRSDATRNHLPGALRIDIAKNARWKCTRIEVPHQRFEDVFHAEVKSEEINTGGQSSFIRELAALESTRTASGAGLAQFLEANLGQFDASVANEIRLLAKEVLDHAY